MRNGHTPRSTRSRARRRARLAVGLSLAVLAPWTGTAAMAVAAVPMSAASGGRTDPPGRQANNCVLPWGISLNEIFDVRDQFVNPACPGLTAGEHWRPITAYYGSEAADAVYPPGYVPLRAAPVDDVLAKVTFKIVIDGGTKREKTYRFSAAEAVRTDVRIHQVIPSFPDLPSFYVIPRMAPLSVGHHTREMFWVLSAESCDGLTTDEAASCFGPGEFPGEGGATDVATPERGNGG
jgi:hypothetical protein